MSRVVAGCCYARLVPDDRLCLFLATEPEMPAKEIPLMATSKTQPTVTLKHISAALAEARGIAKKEAEGVLNETVDLLVKHLKKGDRIRIAGFGILQVKKRPARMGRNPATGEPIKIKASKRVAFRAAKELKESV